MLVEIGVESADELFADIPADLRLSRPLELPDGLSVELARESDPAEAE